MYAWYIICTIKTRFKKINSTCYIIPNANSCESNYNKVDGIQCIPAFNVFEDDSWDGDKDNAPGQDEENGGGDTDFSLTNLPMSLLKRETGQI